MSIHIIKQKFLLYANSSVHEVKTTKQKQHIATSVLAKIIIRPSQFKFGNFYVVY